MVYYCCIKQFQEIVHFAPNYDNGQLLRLLIDIYNGVPESYEVFYCSEDSTEVDLKLFLHRASAFRCVRDLPSFLACTKACNIKCFSVLGNSYRSISGSQATALGSE